MRIFILLIILSSLSFSACKKKELNFKLKGTVTASNTGNALAGVSIKVFTSSLGNSIEALKESTQTDASGNYEITLQRDKYEKVAIRISKDNYFNEAKIYSFDDLTTEKANTTNHIMSPKSWTRFTIKKNDPTGTLKILKNSGKIDCEECCDNGFTYYTGTVDTEVICANNGDTWMKFQYWKGDETHVVDSVFNTAFQTVDYEIRY